MRIDSLSIYRFETKLASPWITAYGADYTVEQVLFCLRSGGVEGWGEASPLNLPTYSPEYSRGVFDINREVFAKQLIGDTGHFHSRRNQVPDVRCPMRPLPVPDAPRCSRRMR